MSSIYYQVTNEIIVQLTLQVSNLQDQLDEAKATIVSMKTQQKNLEKVHSEVTNKFTQLENELDSRKTEPKLAQLDNGPKMIFDDRMRYVESPGARIKKIMLSNMYEEDKRIAVQYECAQGLNGAKGEEYFEAWKRELEESSSKFRDVQKRPTPGEQKQITCVI